MKSNASLWEQYPGPQLAEDLLFLGIRDLEAKYNTNRKRIHVACRHFGIPVDSRLAGRPDQFPAPPKESLIEDLMRGKSFVAKKYGCTIPVINRWIKKYNIYAEPYAGVKSHLNRDVLVAHLMSGRTVSQIATIEGVSHATVQRAAARYGVELQTQSDINRSQREYLSQIFSWIVEQNQSRDILDISREIKVNHSTVLTFLKDRGHNIISHGYNKSAGELEVVQEIIDMGVGCISVKRSFDGKTYELDAYVPSHGLAVEYCGEYWHSDLHKPKNYHRDKYMWCKSQGITLITIFEHEWKTKRDLIVSMIRSRLGMNDRVYARNTRVVDISSADAFAFHQHNHLSGGIRATLNKAMVQDGKVLGVMSISKSRFHKGAEFEIARMSFARGVTVVGGASKLFKSFCISSCMTYSDLRVGDGNTYEKVGFVRLADTPPGYFYFHKDTQQRHSRMKFQKKRLPQLLKTFDPGATEYDNMIANGYLRVWDCGNAVFVWSMQNTNTVKL